MTSSFAGLGFIGWLIIGLVAGFIASKIYEGRGQGVVMDFVLGAVGALVGGTVFQLLGLSPGGGLIYSFIVAVIGAIIVLFIYHAVFDRRTL